MPRFTDQQTISFSTNIDSRLLIVQANGGSLTIEAYDGVNFIATDTVTADAANELYTKGARLRFTPAGGAVYNIDDSIGKLP